MIDVFISVLGTVTTDKFSGKAANAMVTDLETGEKHARFIFDFVEQEIVEGFYVVQETPKGALKILARDVKKSLAHNVAAKTAREQYAALKKEMGL